MQGEIAAGVSWGSLYLSPSGGLPEGLVPSVPGSVPGFGGGEEHKQKQQKNEERQPHQHDVTKMLRICYECYDFGPGAQNPYKTNVFDVTKMLRNVTNQVNRNIRNIRHLRFFLFGGMVGMGGGTADCMHEPPLPKAIS